MTAPKKPATLQAMKSRRSRIVSEWNRKKKEIISEITDLQQRVRSNQHTLYHYNLCFVTPGLPWDLPPTDEESKELIAYGICLQPFKGDELLEVMKEYPSYPRMIDAVAEDPARGFYLPVACLDNDGMYTGPDRSRSVDPSFILRPFTRDEVVAETEELLAQLREKQQDLRGVNIKYSAKLIELDAKIKAQRRSEHGARSGSNGTVTDT